MFKMSLRIRLLRNRPLRVVNNIPMKNWIFSGIYIFLCFILYWFYGGILAPFFLLCFGATGILYKLEDNFVYHPELPPHSRIYVPAPSTYNLPYQTVYIRTQDGTMLHTFFIAQPGEKSKQVPTVLFFHGNAGNMGHRLVNVSGLYHEVQCNILMLEYRGYGFSHGTPSEEGLYMDAQAGIDYLAGRTDINTNEIIVFGRSLGGAVAIDLATKYINKQKIWCLILENTFTSIPYMASLLIGIKFLERLPLLFYKNKFMSLKKIHSINVPTLFISGLADILVPPQMMTELYNTCKSTFKRLVTIPGGTHNETWNQTGYYQHIQSFITELRKKPDLRQSSCHYLIHDI
ncbi:protein ABHD13 [Chelonus insularis]|uniref:protein ABHD13 n=1 Tax=Chelonus insularis TaxID=460826 RepID=UPI00158D94CE|nr:protein ABHD13 [Chelonus insularis]XP_034942138.1 protein ABHD13 [Chelonus insularis]